MACRTEKLKDATFWPNIDTFKNLGPYMNMAIPSTLMICLEWWAKEAFTLMSGYISVPTVAANVILFNISGVIYMLVNGM